MPHYSSHTNQISSICAIGIFKHVSTIQYELWGQKNQLQIMAHLPKETRLQA